MHTADSRPARAAWLTVHWPPWVIFGALAVFALTLRLACLTGLVGSDDLHYAKYAQAVVEGHYGETVDQATRRHHALRYGVILPLAAVYKVLGVAEWTTILVPLAASTASVVLVAMIGRLMFGMQVGIIAGLLYATFPMHLRLGTILLPEPLAGFYALLGVLCYLYALTRGGAWWVIAGLLMGIAYLAKEPALFVGGAFLLHALWARQWRGAVLFALGVATIGAIEHAYYVLERGDILFRPRSTELYSATRHSGGFFPRMRDLPHRLFVKYPEAMLVPDLRFGLHSLAGLLWAGAALASRPRRGFGMLVLWAALPWLYLNFGTWSFQRYMPIPTEPRYIEIIYPPIMLLSAVLLSRALAAGPMIARSAAVALAVVMAVGTGAGLATRGQTADAREMNVLREIVRAAQAQPSQTIYTDVVDWRLALTVFDASLVSESADTATIVLTRDALGLPTVQPILSPQPGTAEER